jgi:cysteine synthase/rhodanese-related sulfurtransferase
MKILQDSAQAPSVDQELLADFDRTIWQRVPHREDGHLVNGSQLVDLTQVLKDCATEEYGLDLSSSAFTVFGKFEAELPGGSVKMRPAAQILRDAIASGRLRRGQVIFEATSGNFGIALGQMAKLQVPVVVLVSRKLQEGVLEALEGSGVKTVNLDVDICPAPGVQMDPNLLVAKIVATNMRSRFEEIGIDTGPFDASRAKVEELLARQDVINLAKALADAYGGFCPAQYENELNVMAHENVTGPEIEQQMDGLKMSLADFNIVCAFGTGGTSTGLSRFAQKKYGKKAVHVIFPPEGQDVAGIRTRAKAAGLNFYRPDEYAGQHDADFQQAKRLLVYLAKKKGLDLGESSALALYAVLQMVNFGIHGKYVVILADGIAKYQRSLGQEKGEDLEGKLEVTLEQARSHRGEYGAVVWTHPGYVPNAEGIKLVAAAIDDEKDKTNLEIASPADVARAVATRQIPPGLTQLVENRPGRILLVCMSGMTSLRMAQALAEKGFKTQSLTGGISNIARESGKPVLTLVKPAS